MYLPFISIVYLCVCSTTGRKSDGVPTTKRVGLRDIEVATNKKDALSKYRLSPSAAKTVIRRKRVGCLIFPLLCILGDPVSEEEQENE